MFKRYRLLTTLTKNFNKKFLNLWPSPHSHPGWVVMVLHKTSDQYLQTCKVSIWSINMFKRYRLLKSLMKNFNIKFLSLWPWPQGHPMVLHKTSDQYLPTCKVSTWSINMFKRYRLLKNFMKNFNIKFLSLWPWPQGHPGWVMMVLHKTSVQYLPIHKVSTWYIYMFKRYRLPKNFNRKCDVDVHVNVNADDRGDNNSSVHFVQAS